MDQLTNFNFIGSLLNLKKNNAHQFHAYNDYFNQNSHSVSVQNFLAFNVPLLKLNQLKLNDIVNMDLNFLKIDKECVKVLQNESQYRYKILKIEIKDQKPCQLMLKIIDCLVELQRNNIDNQQFEFIQLLKEDPSNKKIMEEYQKLSADMTEGLPGLKRKRNQGAKLEEVILSLIPDLNLDDLLSNESTLPVIVTKENYFYIKLKRNDLNYFQLRNLEKFSSHQSAQLQLLNKLYQFYSDKIAKEDWMLATDILKERQPGYFEQMVKDSLNITKKNFRNTFTPTNTADVLGLLTKLNLNHLEKLPSTTLLSVGKAHVKLKGIIDNEVKVLKCSYFKEILENPGLAKKLTFLFIVEKMQKQIQHDCTVDKQEEKMDILWHNHPGMKDHYQKQKTDEWETQLNQKVVLDKKHYRNVLEFNSKLDLKDTDHLTDHHPYLGVVQQQGKPVLVLKRSDKPILQQDICSQSKVSWALCECLPSMQHQFSDVLSVEEWNESIMKFREKNVDYFNEYQGMLKRISGPKIDQESSQADEINMVVSMEDKREDVEEKRDKKDEYYKKPLDNIKNNEMKDQDYYVHEKNATLMNYKPSTDERVELKVGLNED